VSVEVLLRRGRFEDPDSRSELHEALLAAQGSGRRLVIHFHGGLVNRQAGLAIAQRLGGVYAQAGGFPISVIWRSGLGETITGGLSSVGDQPLFKRLLARIVQFQAGRIPGPDGRRGGSEPALTEVYERLFAQQAGEPFDELDGQPGPLSATESELLAGVLRSDAVVREGSLALASAAGAPAEEEAAFALSPELLEELAGEQRVQERSALASVLIARRAVAAAGRVAKRMSSGRGHGLHATAVEELLRALYVAQAGSGVWGRMKQDALEAFGQEDDSGGRALVQELAALTLPTPPLLVGHSTGAIWICRLLAGAAGTLPAGQRFDVALLAPACDFRLLERTLTDHGGRVRLIRVFGMRDQLECADRLLSGVYPRSLLYLVSGALEEQADWPLVGMERFHTDGAPFTPERFPEIGRARAAIAAGGGGCVWSLADEGPGRASGARRHGDFDDDPVTLRSVAEMVAAR